MIEKLKVKKNQAKAIEILRQNHTDDQIMADHADGWKKTFLQPLNKLNALDLARALLIGYEVEETPEEKLLDMYKYRSASRTDREHSVVRETIFSVLEITGKKVPGINE
ncbi:hypothetical protein [Paenibacillus xylanexedens]|uniref:hypothetical protein n=1 Tax=Paenibacillus xylanexedens TaxID=528191 RepID=UPI000F534B1D|nr:hypothetical protein [Paenibacillus xylanexedens]RPK29844.1 hypothetical protein EDO6_00468 [Paenibacillus xylanexedens]